MLSTGCLWFVWASGRRATPLNSRHFVNFAAVVLQVGLSQLHPHSWVHRRTYSDCMFPSLASVHVKGCTCVFTQECGFLFFARHLWLLFWGVFRQLLLSLLLWKNQCELLRRVAMICCVCVAKIITEGDFGRVISCNAVFSFWGNFGILIRKTLSPCELQKHQHMPKEFQGNSLASWFKLGPLVWRQGGLHNTFPWFSQGIHPGTPPLTQYHLNKAVRPSCCRGMFYLSSSPSFEAPEFLITQPFFCMFCKVNQRESNRCSLDLLTAADVALGRAVCFCFFLLPTHSASAKSCTGNIS